MERIVVKGGKRLSGEVSVGGSKHAALPILFGGIVTGERCVFSNLPRVSDVLRTLEILKCLGARICFLGNGDVRVDYSTVRPGRAPAELTGSIRGSTYLLGAMLARFGCAELAAAGGCNFGSRPIDQHLMGFARLGAEVTEDEGGVRLSAPRGLRGCEIPLAMPSVGATANLLLAASAAAGESVIINAAAEPHVAALAAFLGDAGADISGIGSPTVRVIGKKTLRGISAAIIPDMIEAGTYLALGMACEGPVRVDRVCPSHLGAFLELLRQMGGCVEVESNAITVSAPRGYSGIAVETGPFPQFPTDLHPQMTALLSLGGRCVGEGSVTERVFASRFAYVDELCRMGASIRVRGDTVLVAPAYLRATRLRSPDLRGGAALLIAALATAGQSEIVNAVTVGRGYEHLEEKLHALGACVRVE